MDASCQGVGGSNGLKTLDSHHFGRITIAGERKFRDGCRRNCGVLKGVVAFRKDDFILKSCATIEGATAEALQDIRASAAINGAGASPATREGIKRVIPSAAQDGATIENCGTRGSSGRLDALNGVVAGT